MVVGMNGYTGSRFPQILKNPLTQDNPSGQLMDYGSMPYSATFDDQNNLYVTDLDRSRILIYLCPFSAPSATPTITGTPPTITDTLTVSETQTITATNTATPTPTDTSSVTATNTNDTSLLTTSPTVKATPTITATACSSGNLSWIVKAPMPTGRDRLAACQVNGILYAVGGQNISGDNLTTLEAYNPATNTWTSLAPMPTGREDLAVEAVNGIIYAIGGYNGTTVLNTVEAYNPSTNTWTSLAPMPTSRCNLSVAVVNGIIYAIGGNDAGANPLNTVEAYNPATNTWTTGLAAMPTARCQFSAGVVNGIIYAAGGSASASFILTGMSLTTLEAYNPATNTWTTGLAPMPTGEEDTGGDVMNGLFYVAGGCSTIIGNAVMAYDPGLNTWTTITSMPNIGAGQGVKAVNGVLYTVGGWNNSTFMTTNQAGALMTCATPTVSATLSATPTYTISASGTLTATITPTWTITATAVTSTTFTATATLTIPPTPTPTWLPLCLTLYRNSPNPFAEGTYFIFDLCSQAEIKVKIYTISGEVVRELEQQGAQGMNSIYWDSKNKSGMSIASGIYIYSVEAVSGNEKKKQWGKMAVVK